MVRILTIPSILIFSLLSACTGKQSKPAAGQVIDMSAMWTQPEEIRLSSIATDIEYVPLETPPACLLGDPDRMKATVTDNHIAISSRGLHLFNRQGKYLRTIGSIGEGPQEYLSSAEYVIDEKKQRVDILDGQRYRVVTYNLNGEFIGSFNINKRSEPELIRDKAGRLGIFYLTPVEDTDNPTRLEWVTDAGVLLKSVPVYHNRPKGGGAFMAIMSTLTWSGDDLLFNENPFDTIYHLIGDRSWEPRWIVDAGPRKMPAEVSLDLASFNAGLDRYDLAKFGMETSRYIFFAAHGVKGEGIALYDKAEQKPRLMMQVADQSTGGYYIPNDLDGGLPLVFGWMIRSEVTRGDEIVTLLSPPALITKLKEDAKSVAPAVSHELREKFLKMVEKLQEDDNPVVMVVRMKKLK